MSPLNGIVKPARIRYRSRFSRSSSTLSLSWPVMLTGFERFNDSSIEFGVIFSMSLVVN